jgi:transglutaminase-like putative cysteine protease
MARLRTHEGKLSFFLLMVMLLCIAWSMEFAGWVEGLYVVEWTALGGLAVGFLMTRLGWPRPAGHVVSVIIGGSLTIAVVGRFIDPTLGLRDGVDVLAYHFDAWLRLVTSGKSVGDAVIFVLLMTMLGWWLGYVCAWMVFGAHRVFQAIALSGTAMLLVAYGSPPDVAPFFVLFVLCALFLAIRLYVYNQERSWDRQHARYDHDLSLNFLRDGGVLVLAVVVVVWIAPLLASSSLLSDLWATVEGPWRAAGDQWNRLFSGVVGYNRGYENVPFGDRLALGGPIELGGDMVMWVNTDGDRYWRGAVYDQYDGRGWSNTDSLTAVVPAQRDFPGGEAYDDRRVIEQTIVPDSSAAAQVFQSGEPVTVDVPVEVRYDYLSGSAGDGRDPWAAPVSVSAATTRVPVSVERPYRVLSTASAAGAASLRNAGQGYPEWVSGRYLQLPSTLPDRVAQLGRQLAAPHDNAYDQAGAIQDYLRNTIQYRDDVEAPPEDRDAIDYLLFDTQQGYCNYYASAMVVLARSAGIPARLVVGYAGGELEKETGLYAVRQRDTHAWVEVFFPRFGWVEFEPTASVAPIIRVEGTGDEQEQTPGGDPDSQLERDLERLRDDEELPDGFSSPTVTAQRSRSVRVILGGLVVLSLCGSALVWHSRSRRAEDVSTASKIYRRLCRFTRLLGIRGQPSQTPYEYAEVVAERLPEIAAGAGRIVQLFVRDQFDHRGAGLVGQQEAMHEWTGVRPLLWRRLPRRALEVMRSALHL